MDHYPYPTYTPPQKPLYPPVEVPYIAKYGFDGGDFTGYPARSGWDKAVFISGEVISAPDAAAFLQRWLFFGVLHNVVCLPGTYIVTDNFVRQGAETWIVNTSALPSYIERWEVGVKGMRPDEALTLLERAEECLDEASVYSHAASVHRGGGFRLGSYCAEIHLSIMALGDLLGNTVRRMRRKIVISLRPPSPSLAAGGIGGGPPKSPSKLGGHFRKISDSVGQGVGSFVKGHLPLVHTITKDYQYMYDMAIGNKFGRFSDEGLPDESAIRNWGYSEILAMRMVHAGWCPYNIHRMLDILSPWAAHYASALDRSNSNFDHSHCTEQRCRENEINEETYQTKHIGGCQGGCGYVEALGDKVRSILDGGGFPVITLSKDDRTDEIIPDISNGSAPRTSALPEKIGVTLTNRKSVAAVAISHVWSDGLGNARANSLPRCQLRGLFKQFRKVGAADFFRSASPSSPTPQELLTSFHSAFDVWIDTLAVPLVNENDRRLGKDYRKLAIASLQEVYSSCGVVLALDGELQRTSMRTCSKEECLIRLACSNWMRRLWTFQEGGSSMQLFIRFAEGIFRAHNAFTELTQARPDHSIFRGGEANNTYLQMRQLLSGIGVPLQQRLGTLSPSMALSDDDATAQCARTAKAWNGMRWRTATRDGDVVLVLAQVVFNRPSARHYLFSDFSASTDKFKRFLDLTGTPQHAGITGDKMTQTWKAFYSLAGHFPQGILFSSGPTIQEDGLRWAPCAVGTYGSTITDDTPALITPRGLLVRYPGYFLPPLRCRLNDTFEAYDYQRREWLEVSPVDKDGEGWPDEHGTYALVSSNRRPSYARSIAVLGMLSPDIGKDQAGGVEYLKFVRKVYVSRISLDRVAQLEHEVERNPDVASGPKISQLAGVDSGLWCVG